MKKHYLVICYIMGSFACFGQNNDTSVKFIYPQEVQITISNSGNNSLTATVSAPNPNELGEKSIRQIRIRSLEAKIAEVSADSIVFQKTKAYQWFNTAQIVLDSLKSLEADD